MLRSQLSIEPYQCRLEDVSRESLDARIHRLALDRLALGADGRRQVRERAHSPKLRAREALNANLFDHVVEVGAQVGEALKVPVHDLFGGGDRNAKPSTQPEGLHAVDETVGDGLW